MSEIDSEGEQCLHASQPEMPKSKTVGPKMLEIIVPPSVAFAVMLKLHINISLFEPQISIYSHINHIS